MREAAHRRRAAPKSTIRCAVYTRKSHEEGLEQDFNSLDAQRAACEAYITSQKHEGLVALPQMYDDGGISGATTSRSNWAKDNSMLSVSLPIEVVVLKALCRFAMDVAFASLSAAASIVAARSASGPREWKAQGSGLSYREWRAERLREG